MRGDVGKNFAHVIAAADKVANNAVARAAVGSENVRIAQTDRLEGFIYLTLREGAAVGQFDAKRFCPATGFIALGVRI